LPSDATSDSFRRQLADIAAADLTVPTAQTSIIWMVQNVLKNKPRKLRSFLGFYRQYGILPLMVMTGKSEITIVQDNKMPPTQIYHY